MAQNLRNRIHRMMVTEPVIPTNSSLKHVGTAFQLSRSTDFTDSSAMILEGAVYAEDGSNILLIENQIQIGLDEVVYSRYAYIFGDKNALTPDRDTYTVNQWSRISSSHGDQVGFKFDNTVLATPVIDAVEVVGSATLSGYKFTVSGFKVLVGDKSPHAYTTWEISNTNNEVIYSRVKDEDNLTELILKKDLFNNNELYFIRAKLITATNAESNWGCFAFNPSITANAKFDLDVLEPFYYGMNMFMRLKLMTTNVTHVRLVVKEVAGDFESRTAYDQTVTATRSIKIPSTNFEKDKTYRLYACVKYDNNTYSALSLVKEFTVKENTLYPVRTDSRYSEQGTLFSYPGVSIGAGVMCTRELRDGSFVMGVNSSLVAGSGASQNEFILYARYGDSIRTTNIRVQLPSGAPSIGANDLNYPYVNVLPLYDDRVVINYCSYATGNDYQKSVWCIYEVDWIKKTYTCLGYKVFQDEGFSTAVSGSAVVCRDNSIIYIPAEYYSNVSNNTLANLPLFKLVYNASGAVNNKFTRSTLVSAIKNTIVRNITICPFNDLPVGGEQFILMGGSTSSEWRCTDKTTGSDLPGLFYYKLENLNTWIYTYNSNSGTGSIAQGKDLPETIRTQDNNVASIYCISSYRRADGKIVVFNNSPTTKVGGEATDTRTWLMDYDKTDGTFFVSQNNDTSIDMPFRSTIALKDGSFLRIGNTLTTMPPILGYMADPVNAATTTPIVSNKVLVVNPGERLSIENPYIYESIEVLGTSDADTGILTWVDTERVRTWTYTTRIITRDTTETQAEADAKKKEHLYVLDGVKYKIKDN